MTQCKHKADLLGDLTYMLKNINIESKTAVDPVCTATINMTIKLFQDKQCNIEPLHFLQLESVMYRFKEYANTGKWNEIDDRRHTITVISFLRLLVHMTVSPIHEKRTLEEGFKIIDNGLLFGKPLDEDPQLLHRCADVLKRYYNPDEKNIVHLAEPTKNLTNEMYGKFIDELDCPSLVNFSQNYLKKSQPLVIKKSINHWPAVSLWQDLNYFIKMSGARTVPIEIGGKYTDQNWTQKIMTMKDFIYQYILTNNKEKGYLAQHQLFNQLPELRSDIKEPEYCCLAESDDGVDMNAWFGPKGTVSPLHFDPKHNFLSQVVGEKLVILYGPDDSSYLYPHGDNLSNTSRVDPKNPKYADFPEFLKATPYFCILKPGDMLFIPQKWWHYVESRTISFSVSFWWM